MPHSTHAGHSRLDDRERSDSDRFWRILVLTRPGPEELPEPAVPALRDLGHHVVDLDLDGHRLLGPDGTTVALDRLVTLVERVLPQVIIDAGGAGFLRPADADLFRARGYVVLGLEVSSSGGVKTTLGGQTRAQVLHHEVGQGAAADQGWLQLWTEALDSLHRLQGEDVLEPILPRAKKVIVSGYYGSGNLGDELILTSIVQALHRADASVQVTVAAENRWAAERAHGLQAFTRHDHEAAAHQVRTAAAVVLGGGGLWHDYSFERSGELLSFFTGAKMSVAGYGILPMMARILGRPFHVIGMGAGPLTSQAARGSVRLLAVQASSITVRDSESAELLTSLPLEAARITTAPDVVYALDLSSPEPLEDSTEDSATLQTLAGLRATHTVVGLNLRAWDRDELDTVVEAVVDALAQLAELTPLAVVSVPFQQGPERDQQVIRTVVDRLPERVRRVELPHRPSLSELMGVYRHLDVLVSMRLHAALLAHRLGVPVVGLDYDPKVRRHFEEVDRSEFCLPLLTTGDEVLDRIHAAQRHGLPESTRAIIQGLESRARQSLDRSAEQVAAAERPDTSHLSALRATADRAAGAARPADLTAAFSGMRFTATGVQSSAELGRDRHRATAAELRICLNTDRPRPGDSVSWTGRLTVPGAGPHAVELELENEWTNSRATSVVIAELEACGIRWSQDLSLSADPVRIRLPLHAGTAEHVSFRLRAERTGFHSAGWPAATTSILRLVDATPVSTTGTRPMASAGQLQAVPAQTVDGGDSSAVR